MHFPSLSHLASQNLLYDVLRLLNQKDQQRVHLWFVVDFAADSAAAVNVFLIFVHPPFEIRLMLRRCGDRDVASNEGS